MGTFKWALKWAAMIAIVILATPLLNELSIETRLIGGFFLLLILINYNDGEAKERIEQLEYRVDELTRRLTRYE